MTTSFKLFWESYYDRLFTRCRRGQFNVIEISVFNQVSPAMWRLILKT